jgi:hypothetical protein
MFTLKTGVVINSQTETARRFENDCPCFYIRFPGYSYGSHALGRWNPLAVAQAAQNGPKEVARAHQAFPPMMRLSIADGLLQIRYPVELATLSHDNGQVAPPCPVKLTISSRDIAERRSGASK